jgi:LPS sulfotransferase NodH/SAM-dependent methyltransferase
MIKRAAVESAMQTRSGTKRRGVAEGRPAGPITRLTDPRLDFPGPVRLRKSYIVASTDRSGSTFLCSLLWQTGVLGAPAEYWNFRSRPKAKPIGAQMMERLEAASAADYLDKLLACRTSRNGIFSVKAHSFDFEEAVRQFPEMLERLSPLTYIYIERKDKVAQAVSMAKAAQTGVWVSYGKMHKTENLHYDKELIARCLGFLERQHRDWLRWFETNQIEPFIVAYEDLLVDHAGVVRSIVKLLGAENDKPQKVHLPKLEKQSDQTNEKWVARFRRESAADDAGDENDKPDYEVNGDTIVERPEGLHVFDSYEQVKDTAAKPIGAMRLRYRYDAIVGRNRALFQNARVLDIHCGDGRWTLAALDAGAAHVVAVENQREQVEAARNIFQKLGIKSSLYELINSEIGPALRRFLPDAFDLILCQEFSKLPDPHLFFNRLRRLQPKHVILDTEMVIGKVPMVSFKLQKQDKLAPNYKGRAAAIHAVPNHELIRILCDYFGFKWRVVDWHTLGITNWTSIHDYESDRRRTYVLEATA